MLIRNLIIAFLLLRPAFSTSTTRRDEAVGIKGKKAKANYDETSESRSGKKKSGKKTSGKKGSKKSRGNDGYARNFVHGYGKKSSKSRKHNSDDDSSEDDDVSSIDDSRHVSSPSSKSKKSVKKSASKKSSKKSSIDTRAEDDDSSDTKKSKKSSGKKSSKKHSSSKKHLSSKKYSSSKTSSSNDVDMKIEFIEHDEDDDGWIYICDDDEKECDDGSVVTRDAENECEFSLCPEDNPIQVKSMTTKAASAASPVDLSLLTTAGTILSFIWTLL